MEIVVSTRRGKRELAAPLAVGLLPGRARLLGVRARAERRRDARLVAEGPTRTAQLQVMSVENATSVLEPVDRVSMQCFLKSNSL